MKPKKRDLAGTENGTRRRLSTILRRLSTILMPDGIKTDLIANEVINSSKFNRQIASFLKRYNETVLNDGITYGIQENKTGNTTASIATGYYFIRIDPSTVSLDGLVTFMKANNMTDNYTFSSYDALRNLLTGRKV